MPTVFISYRRADSADITGRIYDRLVERYGQAQIFKDVDSIPPGANFPDYIEESIQASDAALVVIGPRWLDASYGWGRRHLDDPVDFVRVEIETALRQGVPVIPARRMPESLRPLLRQNGLAVRPDPDFSHDMDRVFAAIDYWQAQPRARLAPVTPEAPSEPATEDKLPAWQPLSQAAASATGATAHPAPTEHAPSPAPPAAPARVAVAVASRPRPRQRVARLPLLLSALAIVLVAGLVLAPYAVPLLNGRVDLFLTPAQRTSTAQAGAVTQTAHAGATTSARAQQTVNAISTIAAHAKKITLGYTSAAPGCDTTYWIPTFASKVVCSPTSATLTAYGNGVSGVTAYINESPEVYTVQVTVSHLQSGCAIELDGDSGTLFISLDAQPAAARWTIVSRNEDDSTRSGTIPLSSSYTLVMRLLPANEYAFPNILTLTINGTLVQNVGKINPQPSGEYATYSPGRLQQVLLVLHSDGTPANANRQLSAHSQAFASPPESLRLRRSVVASTSPNRPSSKRMAPRMRLREVGSQRNHQAHRGALEYCVGKARATRIRRNA